MVSCWIEDFDECFIHIKAIHLPMMLHTHDCSLYLHHIAVWQGLKRVSHLCIP